MINRTPLQQGRENIFFVCFLFSFSCLSNPCPSFCTYDRATARFLLGCCNDEGHDIPLTFGTFLLEQGSLSSPPSLFIWEISLSAQQQLRPPSSSSSVGGTKGFPPAGLKAACLPPHVRTRYLHLEVAKLSRGGNSKAEFAICEIGRELRGSLLSIFKPRGGNHQALDTQAHEGPNNLISKLHF